MSCSHARLFPESWLLCSRDIVLGRSFFQRYHRRIIVLRAIQELINFRASSASEA
jgi:hypothetical protein